MSGGRLIKIGDKNMKKTQGDYLEMAANKVTFTYDEFVDFCECYGEVEFWYKNKMYGVVYTNLKNGEKRIGLFEGCIREALQNYSSTEEFAKKVNLDGKLLKDMWGEIYDVCDTW